MRGARRVVLKMKPAPKRPPANFHNGCEVIAASMTGKPPRDTASIPRTKVPTTKEIKAATMVLPSSPAANWPLMFACVAMAAPAQKARIKKAEFIVSIQWDRKADSIVGEHVVPSDPALLVPTQELKFHIKCQLFETLIAT